MVSRDEIIAILSKYGMDSKYQTPYLYEEEGRVGILYSFSHVFYGLLERVKWFETIQEADDFIYQLWWYRKYQTEFAVTVSFSDYEILTPEVSYQMENKNLTVADMKSLLVDPEELPREKKKLKLYQRLVRTARILVSVIEEKIKVQNDTYRNVKELDSEFQKQENEFYQLLSRYQKKNYPLHVISDTSLDLVNMDSEIQSLNDQIDFLMNHPDFGEMKKFIDALWETLLHMECEKGYLQNKYLLFKLPLDLEDIRKKKSYMEFVFNKKKGLFSRKEHVLDELKKIDNESESKKIIGMKDYIENEIKRLEEKYSIIDEMDYATLGDYLNEFDNLGISSPFDSQDKPTGKVYTRDELLKKYQDIYDSLSQNEQCSMAIYHSFLQPVCDAILRMHLKGQGETEILSIVKKDYGQDITQGFNILVDPENVFFRMQKMKLLSIVSETEFLKSLYQVCLSLLAIKSFRLNGITYLFGKSGKDDVLELYHASLRNTSGPTQIKGKYEVHDVLEIHTGVSLLFFPLFYQVRDLYFHDNTIDEVTDCEDVVLFLKNYQLKFDNSDIIKVSRFHFKEKSVDSYKVFYGTSVIKKEQYRHIVVTK